MTKSIRITEKAHSKLKIHVAKNKTDIVEFASWAIEYAMKDYDLMQVFGDYQKKIHSVLYPKIKSSNNKTK